MSSNNKPRRVHVLTTGGTIASRKRDVDGDVVAAARGADLLASVSGVIAGIDVTVEDFCQVGSYAMDLPLVLSLSQRIRQHLSRSDCDGVVVTHGTDTMEESAYLCDLTVPGDKPVVFTGAQRNADMPNTDGPENLRDAISLAATPAAGGMGTLLCFDGTFHASRDVTKTHTTRLDAFGSRGHGPLGTIAFGQVDVRRRCRRSETFDPTRLDGGVQLLKLSLGADPRMIVALRELGATAIVIEAFGLGNAPPALLRPIEECVDSGVPVIISSRCAEGSTRPLYGNGGGRDLERSGAIFASDLAGTKARLLASVLLGSGHAGHEFEQAFVRCVTFAAE